MEARAEHHYDAMVMPVKGRPPSLAGSVLTLQRQATTSAEHAQLMVQDQEFNIASKIIAIATRSQQT